MTIQLDTLPPLSLYIHIPWCIKKCPYCDFNSHEYSESLPEDQYVSALLADLENELPKIWGRRIRTIFIGGGTPSLFSADAIDRLITNIRSLLPVSPTAEITLEANPGTVEQAHFYGYQQAGINRLSLGAQSFHPAHLAALGRIHTEKQIFAAIDTLKKAGINNFNIDLMFGLPNQTLAQALADVKTAIELAATHISYYHLTIEPNTAFYHSPPSIPDEDDAWEIHQAGKQQLQHSGFIQYETSAFAKPGKPCQHNVNYWSFGDYLGIGAGAHSKISDAHSQTITRYWKTKHPKAYLDGQTHQQFTAGQKTLSKQDIIIEFMMNALRLNAGFSLEQFQRTTGLAKSTVSAPLQSAIDAGFITLDQTTGHVTPTTKGNNYLNSLLALF